MSDNVVLPRPAAEAMRDMLAAKGLRGRVNPAVAPAFDLELPDPPDRGELLDKAEHVRRLALHLPEPDLEPELTETHCPTCGCDVTGCTASVGDDGLRRWKQPTKEEWHQGRHFADLSGGLTHIEGGRRCLSDAEDADR